MGLCSHWYRRPACECSYRQSYDTIHFFYVFFISEGLCMQVHLHLLYFLQRVHFFLHNPWQLISPGTALVRFQCATYTWALPGLPLLFAPVGKNKCLDPEGSRGNQGTWLHGYRPLRRLKASGMAMHDNSNQGIGFMRTAVDPQHITGARGVLRRHCFVLFPQTSLRELLNKWFVLFGVQKWFYNCHAHWCSMYKLIHDFAPPPLKQCVSFCRANGCNQRWLYHNI